MEKAILICLEAKSLDLLGDEENYMCHPCCKFLTRRKRKLSSVKLELIEPFVLQKICLAEIFQGLFLDV